MPLPPLETTRYDVEDGIATITLHRPEKLNAYNGQMRVEIGLLFDETDADDAVRAVIVTGAGRAFCAGADLSSGGDTFDRKAPQNQRTSRSCASATSTATAAAPTRCASTKA